MQLANRSSKKPLLIGIMAVALAVAIVAGATISVYVEGSNNTNGTTSSSPISSSLANATNDTICSPISSSLANATNGNISSTTISSSLANNGTSDQNLKVVSSVAPITNIVKNIGGDRIELTGMVPEGADSHTFELTPLDAVTVSNASLVIINGLNLEVDFERVVEAAGNPDLQLLKLADNTITRDQWVFDFSFPEEGGDPNPHLWLNVAHVMKYAELVCHELAEMDPANADYYSSNAERYLAILQELDNGITQAVQTVPPENRKLVTYHDSWAYFAPRYNMTVIGAVQPSDFGEPTPQDVARIIDQLRAERVPAIFASEVFPSTIVDQIAREANVQVVETLSDDDLPGELGDPENTYVGMMLANMRAMITALGGNVDALEGIDPSNTYV